MVCLMKRSYTGEAKKGKILLKGWVDHIRDLGNIKFFQLKDREGTIQITVKKGKTDEEILKTVESLHREDCISVEGKVKKNEEAPGGKEVIPKKMEVVSRAKTPLPLETKEQIESGVDKRFDYRFLDMRNPEKQALLRVRDRILTEIRNYFEAQGFVEVHTPIIQAAGAEGGSTLFPMKYYKEKAYLRQSPQLYKQMLMASSLDRVYEMGPAFRAEKFHTRRHVSEFLSVDFEMAWIDSEEDIMDMLEGMVVSVLKGVKENCKPEMKILGRKVKVPKKPFKRVTYDEALEMIEDEGVELEWGQDMEDAQEKVLGKEMAEQGHEWFFITKYPSKIKPFYIMFDGKYSRGIDLNNLGMEIASGGQREHRYKELVKVMRDKGLNPEDFKFYLDAFSYGMPAHGGIGLGGDRLVQQITGVENIKEAIIFPRTPDRLVP